MRSGMLIFITRCASRGICSVESSIALGLYSVLCCSNVVNGFVEFALFERCTGAVIFYGVRNQSRVVFYAVLNQLWRVYCVLVDVSSD